jgi:hypothetical protein
VPPQRVREAQLKILRAVASAALGRRLSSEEDGACAEALREVSGGYPAPTLPLVVDEMLQCIAVVHRLSDLEAAGGRDSEQVRLARGLLADSETKVIFRQDPVELALVRDLCRLNERETAVVGSLPKGCALWKVGQRSFQVEHTLSAFERQVTYTDERMAVGVAPWPRQ